MDRELNATRDTSTIEVQGKREESEKGSFSPPCLPNDWGPSVSFLWVSRSVLRLCKIRNLPALLEDLEVPAQPGPNASSWSCLPLWILASPELAEKEVIQSAGSTGHLSSPQAQVYIITDLKTGMWNMISGSILTSTLYGLQCITNVREGKGLL